MCVKFAGVIGVGGEGAHNFFINHLCVCGGGGRKGGPNKKYLARLGGGGGS